MPSIVEDKVEQVAPIKLLVKQDPSGQVDSVVYMEWCISEAIKDYLLEQDVAKPFMLLVVSHQAEETDRYVVDLKAGAQYVRFRHPGVNTVHATIVWDDDSNPKRTLFRTRRDGSYKTSLLDQTYPEQEDLKERRDDIQRQIDLANRTIQHEESFGLQPHEEELDPNDPHAETKHTLQQQIDALEHELWLLDNPEVAAADPLVPREPNLELIAAQTALREELTAKMQDVQKKLHMAYATGKPIASITSNIRYTQGRYEDHYKVNRIGASDDLEVHVPQDMFAKEPHKLWKWLAGYYEFWQGAPKDQCHMRKRALFTLSTIWLVLLIKGLFYATIGVLYELFQLLCVGVLLLFGMRNIDYSQLRHPFEDVPKKLWRNIMPSVWLHKKTGDGHYKSDYKSRSAVFGVVNPPVFLLFVFLGIIGSKLQTSINFIVIALVLFVAVALCTVFVTYVGKEQLANLQDKYDDRRTAAKKAAHAKHQAMLAKELEDMSCELRPTRTPSYETLPQSKRSVNLRFNHAKSQVCKPFSG